MSLPMLLQSAAAALIPDTLALTQKTRAERQRLPERIFVAQTVLLAARTSMQKRKLSPFARLERPAMKQEIDIPNVKVVILAAGAGSRIDPLKEISPKCLQHVGGIPILERSIRSSLACGLTEFVFVLGFNDERISDFVRKAFPDLSAEFVHYTSNIRTNAGHSLSLSEPHCRDCDFISFDADVVFEVAVISRLLDAKQKNCLCIDRKIQLGQEEIKVVVGAKDRVFKANTSVLPETAIGEFIHIEKISKAAATFLFAELSMKMASISRHQETNKSTYENLIAKGVEFHTVDISGLKWLDMAYREDFETANRLFA